MSTGVPLQDLASPSHQLDVRSSAPGRSEIALAESERLSGNRDFILRYRLAGDEIASGLLLYQGLNENFFLLVAEPPQVVQPDDVPPREYIFVVDVSGSMNGFPLDTAKKLMGDLASVLQPTDTFNIVVFAGGTDTFAPVSVPATPPNLTRALRFLGQKDGGGGTRLLAALERAVAIPRQGEASRSIVLVTDGYIEAEADVFDYVRAHLDEVNFFAFGIGSSVNRFLIEGVARAGLGEPFIVTEATEALEAAARLRRYIDSPVLTGIDVTFRGFDAYEVEPGKVPDLFASRPIVVFGKWRGSAVGTIEISGRTGQGMYQTSIAVSPAAADPRHGALRHLWARTRIAELSDFGPRVPSEQRIAEITSLGLTYGLLTRYTSFVAVQEIVRRTTEGADDVDQPLPLPAGVSDLAVGITRGSEPDLLWLCAIAAALLGCVRLLRPATGAQGGVVRVKTKLLVLTVAVVIAWGLKRHYAGARVDDLGWILSPTARLVGVMTGSTFVLQPEEGYFSRDRLFLIEKSCAGINFMVAAFGMLTFTLLHRVRSGSSAARMLGVSLLASYSAAVLVNAVRIAIAMWLAAHPAALSAFSAADVHRVEGITVFFAGLVALHELVQRLDRRAVLVGRRP